MLDALRAVIHLRAYAQKTPINEYKQEAFALFERMLGSIREDVTRTMAHANFNFQVPPELPELPDFLTMHIDPLTGEDDSWGGEGTPGIDVESRRQGRLADHRAP